MLDLSPRKEDLDPIEIASRDEIAALQLKRLKCTLRHVYDNVPHYRKKFDAAGVHPDTSTTLADLAKFPFTTKAGSARQLSLRAVRRAARADRARARLLRHHRQADRRRLYQRRHRDVGRRGRALDPRRRRPARHEAAQRLWLRPVHRRPRPALRRGAAGLHHHPGLGRHDRAAGAADRRLRARHHHGDAVLHAGDPRRVPPPGHRPARDLAQSRHLRRRALDRRHARRDRAAPSTCTPSTSTACPR